MMSPTLPLTYDECRARFVRAAAVAGLEVRSEPIDARGATGQLLTIDSVRVGAVEPRRALVVLSGVHGVEGFIGSLIQCEFLERLARAVLPADMAILVVHSVNPWGMSRSRRQNESNVDLNRNWRLSDVEPVRNDAYHELHTLACPDSDRLPSIEDLMVAAGEWVETRGLDRVRDEVGPDRGRDPGSARSCRRARDRGSSGRSTRRGRQLDAPRLTPDGPLCDLLGCAAEVANRGRQLSMDRRYTRTASGAQITTIEMIQIHV